MGRLDSRRPSEIATAQCREKRYADAYSSDGRRVVYVGVNYDPAARTVDAVRTEVAVGGRSGRIVLL